MIAIDNNKKSHEDDERERSRIFKEELLKFNTLHGRENFKVPQIGGKELDLYKLFKEVIGRGGSHQVSENKQWKEIVNALELPATCTSASFTLRNHYSKCLHAYEAYYLKAQQNPGMTLNSMMGMNQKAMAGQNFINLSQNLNPATSNSINNPGQASGQSPNQPSSQQEQKFLGKKIIRPENEFNLIFRYQTKPSTAPRDKTYQKKIRMLNAIPDLRRIVLSFESHITSEILWSLNILALFSSNQNCNLILENQPYLMESMTNYMYYCINNITDLCFIIDIIEGRVNKKMPMNSTGITSVNNNYNNNSFYYNKSINKRARSYAEATTFHFLNEINNTINLPTLAKKNKNPEIEKNQKESEINIYNTFEEVTEYELIEHLISLTLILRNLSFSRVNEPCIIKCQKFMNMIYLLFIHSNFQEIKTNSLDIITNLSKHIILKEIRYPMELILSVFECLKSSNREISEQALECLRRLTFASGNEDYFEKMPDEFYEELVNLLISYKVETRESALEIIYFISDQKLPTKTRLGKIDKCINRLIALISSNSVDNKLSKFAACTLAKLAEVPSIQSIIMPYEQELFLTACTDESISKIILGIISN